MEKVQPLQKNEYEISRFPFAKHLAEALSVNGNSLLDSSASNNTELLEQACANLGKLRENAMDAMHAGDFQQTLTEFSIHLAGEHFAEPCYFQKTPSIRLFFPGMLGTSWHTDNWYGHHEKSRTFWLPLTKVSEGAGVHFIDDPDVLARLESGLGKSITLSSINNVCLVHAEEHTAQPGEYLNFSARTLHGSIENRSGSFRCSIDFLSLIHI